MPKVGSTADALGVRVSVDIEVTSEGEVEPRTGGMSVAPSAGDLPYFRIPRRLKHLYRAAAGKDQLRIWTLGEGAFSNGLISDDLCLRVDPENPCHGFVEPISTVPLAHYQAALANTRGRWKLAEE